MTIFIRLGRKLKDLSPATIREIIAVAVILCLAVALSFPQFMDDREKVKIQKEIQQSKTIFESIGIYKSPKKFLCGGLERGLPFPGLRRVLRMQNKAIRHPSKGIIGFHSEQDKFALVLSHERSEFSCSSTPQEKATAPAMLEEAARSL